MSEHDNYLDIAITVVFGLVALFTALRIGFASTTLSRMLLKYLAAWLVLSIVFGVHRTIYFAIGAPFVFAFCWFVYYQKLKPNAKETASNYATATAASGFHTKQANPSHPNIVTFPTMETTWSDVTVGYADFRESRIVTTMSPYNLDTPLGFAFPINFESPPAGSRIEVLDTESLGLKLWQTLRHHSPKIESDGKFRLRPPWAESAERQASESPEEAGARFAEDCASDCEIGQSASIAELHQGARRQFPYRHEVIFEQTLICLDRLVQEGRLSVHGAGEDRVYFSPAYQDDDEQM